MSLLFDVRTEVSRKKGVMQERQSMTKYDNAN